MCQYRRWVPLEWLLPRLLVLAVAMLAGIVSHRIGWDILVRHQAALLQPARFVLSSVGAGLGDGRTEGKRPDRSLRFAPRIILPLLALATLSLPAILPRRSLAWLG